MSASWGPHHHPRTLPHLHVHVFLLRKNLMQSLQLLITNSSSETSSWVMGMDGPQSPWTLQESGVTGKATRLCDPQNGGAQNTLSPCWAHRKYGRKQLALEQSGKVLKNPLGQATALRSLLPTGAQGQPRRWGGQARPAGELAAELSPVPHTQCPIHKWASRT